MIDDTCLTNNNSNRDISMLLLHHLVVINKCALTDVALRGSVCMADAASPYDPLKIIKTK